MPRAKVGPTRADGGSGFVNKRVSSRVSSIGLPVVYCVPGSAAFCSGIRQGDLIVEVNGVPIADAGDYLRACRLEGGDLRLKIERQGRTIDLFVSLKAHRKLKVNVSEMYVC